MKDQSFALFDDLEARHTVSTVFTDREYEALQRFMRDGNLKTINEALHAMARLAMFGTSNGIYPTLLAEDNPAV